MVNVGSYIQRRIFTVAVVIVRLGPLWGHVFEPGSLRVLACARVCAGCGKSEWEGQASLMYIYVEIGDGDDFGPQLKR